MSIIAIFASFSLLVGVLAAPGTQSQQNPNANLPIVDLRYERHQAAFYNQSGNFYNFSNIPYAAPPVGNLRFAAPQPPPVNRNGVNTGSVGHICPQSNPGWYLILEQFLPEYLKGEPISINTSATTGGSSSGGSPQIQLDPRTSEDCLLLDVIVPKPVLDNAGWGGGGAPVLVWIYGGGYASGDKSQYAPAGLIHRGNDDLIIVLLNYRLGAFGFLSGPTFQASGGSANAGLLDQRMALEWVQQYIHLFGGDPGRVTIMGESAGGSSILHQITAYGGHKGPAPFQQAIPQSPGWSPITSNLQQETNFQTFLALANATSLEEARQLPSQALIIANIKQVGNSSYGGYTFGPVVDGSFAPALPGQLLARGQFDQNVKVMVGHNADEGLLFTSPFVTDQATYAAALQSTFPDASPSIINYIDSVLYPPDYSGAYGYTDIVQRTALTIAEYVFTCNTFYLDLALNNQTYAYQFSIPPALHGGDVPYTFYNDGGTVPANLTTLSQGLLSIPVALALQDWIVSFVRDGVPSSPDVQGVPKFTVYGPNAQIEDLNITSITTIHDPVADVRCRWWQLALYN